MNARFSLFNLFVVAVMITTSQVFSAEDDPEVAVSVSNCLEGEAVPVGTCAVSNIKRIESKIFFERKDHMDLLPFRKMVINPAMTDLPDYYVVVKVIDKTTGAIMPIKALITGVSSGVEGKEEVLEIQIEILEDSNVRENKMLAYFDQLIKESTASGEESHELINQLVTKKDDWLLAMDRYYMENLVGSYSLVVEYHSTNTASWNGKITCSPITLQVLNKGSYFDNRL